MFYYFWKAVYAIKYWRVFLAPKQPPATPDAGQSGGGLQAEAPKRQGRIAAFIIYAFVTLLPLCMGVGFGYLHLRVRQELQDQQRVQEAGVAVSARIDDLKLQRRTSRGIDSEFTETRSCFASFSFTPPQSGETVRRPAQLVSGSICIKYTAGAKLKAWVVPGDTRIFVLDEDKTQAYWKWITLALSIFFTGLGLLCMRALLRGPLRVD